MLLSRYLVFPFLLLFPLASSGADYSAPEGQGHWVLVQAHSGSTIACLGEKPAAAIPPNRLVGKRRPDGGFGNRTSPLYLGMGSVRMVPPHCGRDGYEEGEKRPKVPMPLSLGARMPASAYLVPGDCRCGMLATVTT